MKNIYWTYILKSFKDRGYYIGSTEILGDRLERHFAGRSKATMRRRALKLVYKKSFSTRSAAIRFEREIKRQKSKEYIKNLIKNSLGR